MIGVGIPWQLGDPAQMLGVLQPPVWCDWKFDHAGMPGYTPMLWGVNRTTTRQAESFDTAMVAAQADPDTLWLLGNEPEYASQSNTAPDVFAANVRHWQAQCNNPMGLPGVNLGRHVEDSWLPWMDSYLTANGPIPDVWAVHIYAHDIWYWRNSLEAFLQWARRHGVERPVWVTETSAAQYPTAYQVALLEALPQAMRDYPQVEQVIWYSARHFVADGVFGQGDLVDANSELTELGRVYLEVRQAETEPTPTTTIFVPHAERGSHVSL